MSKLHHAIYLTVIGVLAMMVLGLLITKSTEDSNAPANQGVVIFSFVPLDSESESTAAEITTTLIQSLAKIPSLSILTESDLPSDMQEVSNRHLWPKNELVSLVVEGSVKKSDEGTAVTIQLIDASTDSHMWADTYVSQLGNVSEMVAKAVEKQVVLAARR